MRKVDLSNVPKRIGKNKKEVYMWKEAIGQNINFIYDEHNGSFKIKNVDQCYIFVEYEGKEFTLLSKYIINNDIKKLFGKKINWKYKINEIIDDTVKSHTRKIKIINRKWDDTLSNIRRNKWYQYDCLICGYSCKDDNTWINEDKLKMGHGCKCCSGTKVIKGINDIATTDSWMIEYFVNVEDVYTHTHSSIKEALMKCPTCGNLKAIPINRLYKQGFGCTICSDNTSYPEKAMMSILDQLKIDYKSQVSKKDFTWCNRYRYDFYLPDYNMIIETHGLQHYEECTLTNRTLIEEQENDKNKRELALSNGIDFYIELDCRKSKVKWIINSIKKSELNKFLDLSKINPDIVHRFANKTLHQ